MIEHVFFDLDNTLWDFKKNSYCALQKLYAEQHLEKSYDIPFEVFYPKYSYYNELLWEKFRDAEIDAASLKRNRFAFTFRDFNINEPQIIDFFYENYLNTITDFNHLVPKSLDLVKYLQPKYKVHVLTNGFADVTQRKINQSDLKDQFSTITSAEEVDARKPNPLIFQHALNKAGASKENSVFIGDDWVADGIGARDFGMMSIFFNAMNEDLEAENVIIVSDLDEIKNIL